MFGYHIGSMTLYNLKMGIKQIIYSYAEKCRHLMYRLCCLPKEGLFSSGIVCRVEDPTYAYTHGDVIHPCVRYIEEGFEGHQWWMVYTPLYDWNDKLENPRLCYADAPKGQAPTEWKYYCTIIECPEEGYNTPILHYSIKMENYMYFGESAILQEYIKMEIDLQPMVVQFKTRL